MLNRWFGFFALICMVAANGALFWRDVLPGWLIDQPPAAAGETLNAGESLRLQLGIFDARGGRVGTSWTAIDRFDESVHVWSLTALDGMRLPVGPAGGVPPVLSEIRLRYVNDQPDTLDIDVRGLGVPLWLRGENFSGEFACEWRLAHERGEFILPQHALAGLRDMIRPFDRLPGLYVGRTWQVELFNPLAGMLPGFGRAGGTLDTMLVRVTGREKMTHPLTGAPVEVFVVEAAQARAWVADDGKVLRQEVDLPLIGALTLIDERYDESAQRFATQPHFWRDSAAEERPQ